MSATPDKPAKSDTPVVAAPQPGPVSQWLTQQGFEHDVLEPDHLKIEQIGVESLFLPVIGAALKSHGFDYLQCQGGTTKALVNVSFAFITLLPWRKWRRVVQILFAKFG